MAKRIEYIDKLKGVAILFMVMGHVMQISLGVGDVAFNKFYTSFHMPIFMALSGIFIYKYFKEWTFHEYQSFIYSKIKRILLPFITIGGLYSYVFYGNITCLLNGSFTGYWFLPALFICMTVDVTISYILKNINNNIFIDVIVRLFFWILLILLFYYFLNYSYLRGAIYHYPFFVMGIMMVKYEKIKSLLFENDRIIAILVYIFLASWVLIDSVPLGFNLLGIFSIPILIFLFYKLNANIPSIFNLMGQYSLEIYVFHRFFLPSMLNVGSYLVKSIENFDKSQNFIFFFIISLLISLPICFICIWLGKAIKVLPYINLITFGTKKIK